MVFSCLLKGFRIRKHFFKRFPIFVTPIKYNTCMNKTILLVVFLLFPVRFGVFTGNTLLILTLLIPGCW